MKLKHDYLTLLLTNDQNECFQQRAFFSGFNKVIFHK